MKKFISCLFKDKSLPPVETDGVDQEVEDDNPSYLEDFRSSLEQILLKCENPDVTIKRQIVAELSTEANKTHKQIPLVEYGALTVLKRLCKSKDLETVRLSFVCLANLSTNPSGQIAMIRANFQRELTTQILSPHELIARQAARAFANLAVHPDFKRQLGIGCLATLLSRVSSCPGLLGSSLTQKRMSISVVTEVIAALANLAVDSENERDIVSQGGVAMLTKVLMTVEHIISISNDDHMNLGQIKLISIEEKKLIDKQKKMEEALATQCTRALRNISLNPENKQLFISSNVVSLIVRYANSTRDLAHHATIILQNLQLTESELTQEWGKNRQTRS